MEIRRCPKLLVGLLRPVRAGKGGERTSKEHRSNRAEERPEYEEVRIGACHDGRGAEAQLVPVEIVGTDRPEDAQEKPTATLILVVYTYKGG